MLHKKLLFTSSDILSRCCHDVFPEPSQRRWDFCKTKRFCKTMRFLQNGDHNCAELNWYFSAVLFHLSNDYYKHIVQILSLLVNQCISLLKKCLKSKGQFNSNVAKMSSSSHFMFICWKRNICFDQNSRPMHWFTCNG